MDKALVSSWRSKFYYLLDLQVFLIPTLFMENLVTLKTNAEFFVIIAIPTKEVHITV
jgi:hypothetical protein